MDSIKTKLGEFNKRWNIIPDTTYQEEFIKFKTRVLNVFKDIDQHVNREGISCFCNILGIAEEWRSNMYNSWSENIINSLKKEINETKFYRLLQIIFYLPIKNNYNSSLHDYDFSKDILHVKTKEIIELSNINLSIMRNGEEIIFYPKGEKELDKKLVEQVVNFLDNKSQKHFIDALKCYEKSTRDDSIKSAEALRRSLEEFLRYKLNNLEGLDKNILNLLKKLKEDKRDPMIRNVIQQIFSYLDKYFNENSKHKDGDIDNIENEYLIYQVGLLMRYIEFNIKNIR